MLTKETFYCCSFGFGRLGQLGYECPHHSSRPRSLSITESIFSISTGESHSILLTDSFKLYSFGKNSFGQLGLGHNSPVQEPVFLNYLNSKRIEEVVCGSDHTLALTDEGEVFAWGLNLKGQLGLNDCLNRNSPTLVEKISSKIEMFQGSTLEKNEKVVQLAAGALHSLALTSRNRVFASGHAEFRATGLEKDVLRFEAVRGLEGFGKVEKLEAGPAFSVAVVQGNLYVWGKIGNLINSPTQLLFDGSSPGLQSGRSTSPRTGTVESVSCGNSFLIAICKGQLWLFGNFSNTNLSSSAELTRLDCNSKFKSVSCGSSHAAGITYDNHLFIWGSNRFGQCADQVDSSVPIKSFVFKDKQCTKVSCGSYYTLVLTTEEINDPSLEESKQDIECCEHLEKIETLKSELKKLKIKCQNLETQINDKFEAGLDIEIFQQGNQVKKQESTLKYLTPSFEVDFSELSIDPEPIGRGGYGTVFKGNWRGTVVAVKKMKIEGKAERFNEFLQECQTMMSVRHPNIVLFMGACTKRHNPAIILEYCGNGSLWDVLRNHNTPLPWYLRCKIALDIARGVNYLHKFPVPVLHRDLKSLNILLDDAMNGKLADFGWTRFKADTMTNKIGTYQWMAPEVIQGQQYSEKADVYSFGIILWEIASRKPPFKDLNGLQVSQEVVKNNLRPALSQRFPDPFAKLMQRCWDKDPESRPSFEKIIIELESFLKFIEKSAIN